MSQPSPVNSPPPQPAPVTNPSPNAYPQFARATQPDAPAEDDPIPSPPVETPPEPAPAPIPAPTGPAPGSEEFDAQVKARREAAAAIAARLGKLANAAPTQPAVQDPAPPQQEGDEK
jgi:hypothetical protein